MNADTVWQHVEGRLKQAALGDFAPHLREELLKRGGLILLDGLDEVPDPVTRCAQVKQAVQDFAATFSECRFLVTSRTYAYQHQNWKLTGFGEVALRPFTPGQIQCFVEAWYKLDKLAFEAHRDQAELVGTADIRHERLVMALLNAAPNKSDVKPKLLEEYVRDRAGLLAAHGEGLYQFPHRTFQEYLAACHLTVDRFPGRAEPPTALRPEPLARGDAVGRRQGRSRHARIGVEPLRGAVPGRRPARTRRPPGGRPVGRAAGRAGVVLQQLILNKLPSQVTTVAA